MFEEYFEILTSYVNALFEAGAYQKHALMADVVIEASIINNVRVYQGIALFEKTLSNLFKEKPAFSQACLFAQITRFSNCILFYKHPGDSFDYFFFRPLLSSIHPSGRPM